MARGISEYLAPTQDVHPVETGVAAFERAGYRVGRAYNRIAAADQEQGRIAANLIKAGNWPEDIGKLVAASDTTRAKTAPQGVRFRVLGGVGGGSSGFGGATENFSDDPTQNYYTPSYRAHGQVSRGAATLGNLVSDGGYQAAAPAKANGGYPLEESISGGPPETYDYSGVNKANAAAAAYNNTAGVAAENAYWGALGKSSDLATYWKNYYGTQMNPQGATDYQGNAPASYDQSGNPAGSNVQNSGYIANAVSALSDYVETYGTGGEQ